MVCRDVLQLMVCFEQQVSGSSTANFDDCRFARNHASGFGGVVKVTTSTADFYRCEFDNNDATMAGIAKYTDESSGNFSACNFTGNRATETGGGLWFEEKSGLTMADCIMTRNMADSASDGTGFAAALALINLATAHVVNTKFHANVANTEGGAIGATGGSIATLEECEFSHNRARCVNLPRSHVVAVMSRDSELLNLTA